MTHVDAFAEFIAHAADEPLPDVTKDPAARPSRVEIVARGQTFTADRDYPHGSPSPDPSTRMTDDGGS